MKKGRCPEGFSVLLWLHYFLFTDEVKVPCVKMYNLDSMDNMDGLDGLHGMMWALNFCVDLLRLDKGSTGTVY